jgi:hypothetical protein
MIDTSRVGAVSITDKHGNGYRLQMGPVSNQLKAPENVRYGARWRATLPANGWGPPCWHSIHERLARSYKP